MLSKRVLQLRSPGVRFASKAAFGNNLVFLGAPGVGKGTFAKKIAPILGIPDISTGDIIRAEIKNNTPLGLKCKEYTNAGKLVPDEIVSAMVANRLKQADAKNGWILVSAARDSRRRMRCTTPACMHVLHDPHCPAAERTCSL